MFIADIAFRRKLSDTSFQYKRIGHLWYCKEDHICMLALHGFRYGHLFALPKIKDPPYIKGDIEFHLGDYTDDEGLPQKQMLWCGWIWTESDQRGAVYQLRLEVDPCPALIMRDMWKIAKTLKEGQELPPERKALFLEATLEDKQ